MKRLIAVFLVLAATARADGEPAGDFGYYVLSLSWTPSWCAVSTMSLSGAYGSKRQLVCRSR